MVRRSGGNRRIRRAAVPLRHDVPYRSAAIFNKKVRYRCGLLGHDVHAVCDRGGYRMMRAFVTALSSKT
jgi:hypothetical protein